MTQPRRLFFAGAVAWLAVLPAACERKARPTASTEPMVVAVSKPVARVVTDYEDFIGRTDAVETVDVKARVSGYLVRIDFASGSDVRGDEKGYLREVSTLGILATPRGLGPLLAATSNFPTRGAGDLLFVIDPRPYQADYDKANGQVLLAKAKFKLAVADYLRAKEVAKTPGAISVQDVDKYRAQQDEAAAEVVAMIANLESYRLNLDFTHITSPITGKISRNYLTLGNLVNKDDTLLTTVVSEDPMYGYFDVDERTFLRVQRELREGKIKELAPGQFPVSMALANDAGYPHQGHVDFVNNKVDPLTGTVTLRGVFRNPEPAVGPRVLTPGLFVRFRVPVGDPHDALLIADRALGSDQGQKFVYVVDDKNVVRYRKITTGHLQDGGLRVVYGVKPGEWIVVSGLQQVRPNSEVKIDETAMPTYPLANQLAAPKEPAKEPGAKN